MLDSHSERLGVVAAIWPPLAGIAAEDLVASELLLLLVVVEAIEI